MHCQVKCTSVNIEVRLQAGALPRHPAKVFGTLWKPAMMIMKSQIIYSRNMSMMKSALWGE